MLESDPFACWQECPSPPPVRDLGYRLSTKSLSDSVLSWLVPECVAKGFGLCVAKKCWRTMILEKSAGQNFQKIVVEKS